MKPILLSTMMLFTIVVNARNTDSNKLAKTIQLKLYNTLSLTGISTRSNVYPYPVYTHVYSFNILRPSAAISIGRGNRNRHEFELTTLNINKSSSQTYYTAPKEPSSNEFVTTNISVKYEYIINFNKKQEAKLLPSLGLAISPYYTRNYYTEYITSFSPVTQSYIGAEILAVPRLIFNAHRRVFFDINIPLSLSDFYIDVHHEENPTLPAEKQRVTRSNYQVFPRYFSLRVGLGVNL